MFNSSHLNPNIIKALWRQQQELLKRSPEYVTPIINAEDPLDIQCDLEGPKATPYEFGIFRVKLIITPEFPSQAPKGVFITKIFHPNISEKGEICVNTLKKDWNPSQWNLYNLFEVIKCLLIVPFPQSALNEEAGKLFMENYDEYFNIAQMYTKIYAMKNNNNNIKNNINGQPNKVIQNNNDDIEMEDMCQQKDGMVLNDMSNYSQTETKINRNMLDNDIDLEIIRRRSEVPRSNYNLNNLNYNCNELVSKCDIETKKNANNIYNYNNCANNNYIKDINNNNNIFLNYQNINNNHSISSKEKPFLSFLPLMQSNQIKNNNNNIFGYHRSFTDINISYNNRNVNGQNNSKEINKWIMRI